MTAPTNRAGTREELDAILNRIQTIGSKLPHPAVVDSQADSTELVSYARRLREMAGTMSATGANLVKIRDANGIVYDVPPNTILPEGWSRV